MIFAPHLPIGGLPWALLIHLGGYLDWRKFSSSWRREWQFLP